MPKSIKAIILIIAGMCSLTGFVTNVTSPIDYVLESDHSYANNFDYTWPEISQPGATQMRLHFAKLDLSSGYPYDKLIFSNKDGTELFYYDNYNNKDDFWTDWYAGDTIKVRLITTAEGTAYGFKIDKVDLRADMSPPSVLPESHHSYANNFDYTWPEISQPGATQMRLHFAKLDLSSGYPYDKLIFSNKDGTELFYYDNYNNRDNFWTDWYAGDTIKVRLITTAEGTAYGFKIDQVETRPNTGSTSVVQPGVATIAANKTPSPITAQPTTVTLGNNNTTSAPLNTSTSEANYPIPSQNNSSYDSYGNTTPEKPTVSVYNNMTINNIETRTNTGETNYVIPTQNTPYGLYGNVASEKPTVSFYANVTSGTAPLKVLFTSLTTGNPNNYFWVFEPTYSSDWNSKHAVTALHTFKNPGVYTVSLTVTNAAGSTTVTKYNYITVF